MYICVNCHTEMNCHKNGVGFDCGHGHVYPGDRFKCPNCGNMILATNSGSVYDPEHKFQDEYLEKIDREKE